MTERRLTIIELEILAAYLEKNQAHAGAILHYVSDIRLSENINPNTQGGFYPAFNRLMEANLIERVGETNSKQKKKLYKINALGKKAFYDNLKVLMAIAGWVKSGSTQKT